MGQCWGLPHGPGGHRALLQGHPMSWGWLGVPKGSPSWGGRCRALMLHVTLPGQGLGVPVSSALWGQPGPSGMSRYHGGGRQQWGVATATLEQQAQDPAPLHDHIYLPRNHFVLQQFSSIRLVTASGRSDGSGRGGSGSVGAALAGSGTVALGSVHPCPPPHPHPCTR